MKKFFLLFILLATNEFSVKSQTYFDLFGKITDAEAAISECNYDKSADAVVLFDVGRSSFGRVENGYNVIFQRITRIKILTEAGKEYAQVSIPFYQEGEIFEEIGNLEARTYTINGGKVSKTAKFDIKNCYEEKTNERWKTKKIALPDVQPGSIIEYTYRIYSPYFFNLRDWEFQWNIPVMYSEYETRMIPFYEYAWILQGRNSLDEFKNYEDYQQLKQEFHGVSFVDKVYKFGLKNVPAFNDEEFMTSRADNIIKIDFQLAAINPVDGGQTKIMTTWPELVKDYLQHADFGKYIKKCNSKAGDADTLSGKTRLQAFNSIVDYAKDNFRWNNVNSQFATKSPSEFLKKKTGNSAEINLWLVGTLQAAGFEAYPVILSTRNHGKILSDYPFSSAFNTVIAYVIVEGNAMLADATDPFCPNNKISIQCMNGNGLLVDKDKMQWLSLQGKLISNLITSIKIDPTGMKLNAVITATATDFEALTYRNKYAEKKDIILADLSKRLYQVEDSSLRIRYATDRSSPYSYMYKLVNKCEIVNGKIYIMPFLNEVFSENPLKQKTRTYPVDMTYPVKREYKSEIIVPEGYKVEFIPTGSTHSDELFDLTYSATQSETSINVSLSYTFKHSVYTPEEYSRVKTMFDRIVKKSSEKIVFVRK